MEKAAVEKLVGNITVLIESALLHFGCVVVVHRSTAC